MNLLKTSNSTGFARKIFAALAFLVVSGCGASAALGESLLLPTIENQAGQAESEVRPSPACAHNTGQIVAAPIRHPLDTQKFPVSADWDVAKPAAFCWNWKGDPEPQGETEVQILWSRQFLYLRFLAHYRELYVFPETNGRRERLWQRDVAEVFLQPDTKLPDHYKEFEVSPKGEWLDLDIFPGGASNLMCDVKTNTAIDGEKHVWTAEMALPIKCITQAFDPDAVWKLNLFRIEGADPDRRYFAWQPTKTPRPNFHVPEVFGTLKFSRN